MNFILKYYKTFENDLGYIYSLDMVRYNFVLFSENINEYEKLLSRFELTHGCNLKYFLNYKSVGYRHLWNLSIEDNYGNKGSFALGLQLNNLNSNKHSGFIEFNPNKLMQFTQFTSFFEQFRLLCSSIDCVRYDCAIDLPLKRNQVKMIRSSKCNYEYVVHDKEDKEGKEGLILNSSVTEYQGVRNHNKFTKLYDKTKESKLDYDLTRIEFTFDRSEKLFKNLPKFFVYDIRTIENNNNLSSLSNTQMVLIDLLRNSEDMNLYLKNLNYRTRKKIEPYLSDFTLNIDFELVKSVRKLALYFEI